MKDVLTLNANINMLMPILVYLRALSIHKYPENLSEHQLNFSLDDQFSWHSHLSGQHTPVFQKELPKIKSTFISVFLCERRIFRKSDFTGGCMIQYNLGRVTRSYIYTDENVAWSVVNMLKVIILPSYRTVLFLSGSSQIKFPSLLFFWLFKIQN